MNLRTPTRDRAGSGAPQTCELLLRGMTLVAERILALELEDPDGGVLPSWQPGAHIDVVLPDGTVRQYSLCGDPAERRRWRLAVLEQTAGRGGSRQVHRILRPGDRLLVRGPRNHFPLVPAADYLFIAGGIGITPILPMVAEVAAASVPYRLLYGGRSRAGLAFADELRRFGDHVDLIPQDERGLIDVPGALDRCPPGTAVYCCGPEPLIAAVQAACATRPVSLHIERFEAAVSDGTDGTSAAAPAPGAAFDLMLAGSGEVLHVPAGRSVLEVLEDAGVDVPNSCREGICGTCETGVIDGVPDHRDQLLSDAERAAGRTMLVCVSRSHTPRLVLDL